MPRHKHDCTECVYLGEYSCKYHGSVWDVDLYFCSQSFLGRPTVVARYSSYGPDYYSGLESKKNPLLIEAERRARENGLL